MEHLRCGGSWEEAARRMKVVGLDGVGERPNCAEIRLGMTRYNIEMKRCCGDREQVASQSTNVVRRCSRDLLYVIELAAHLLRVYTLRR